MKVEGRIDTYGKEWVWMQHPDIEAEPVEVTRDAFELVHEGKGFKLVKAPVEEVASNQAGGTKADDSEGTAPSHGQSRRGKRAEDD